jgi:hypothetical protein
LPIEQASNDLKALPGWFALSMGSNGKLAVVFLARSLGTAVLTLPRRIT